MVGKPRLRFGAKRSAWTTVPGEPEGGIPPLLVLQRSAPKGEKAAGEAEATCHVCSDSGK